MAARATPVVFRGPQGAETQAQGPPHAMNLVKPFQSYLPGPHKTNTKNIPRSCTSILQVTEKSSQKSSL